MRKVFAFLTPTTASQVIWQFFVFCGLVVVWNVVWTWHVIGHTDRGFSDLAVQALVVGGPFLALFSAISLHQVATLKALYHSARIDPLSGVLNRQTFIRRTRRALAASRSGMLLLMDADFFKQINDKYGHATGDDCIKAIGHRLNWHLRDNDLAGRIGGEEFAIFLPDVTREHGRIVATRLGLPVAFTRGLDEEHLSITLSIGAVWTSREHSTEAQMMMADDALYQAKTTGRARMIIVGEEEPILLGRANADDEEMAKTRRRETSRSQVA